MNRKVLLIEPNYKNKYPPMGLMKIATYFRRCGDDVRFFKDALTFISCCFFYLYLKAILPFDRSYGDISTLTLSPGRIFM